MRVFRLSLSTVVLLAMASCGNDIDVADAALEQANASLLELNLSTDIQAQLAETRALQSSGNLQLSGNFVTGKSVDVFIVDQGSSNKTTYGTANNKTTYTTGALGALTKTGDPYYWPKNGAMVDIYAFYPSISGITDRSSSTGVDFTVQQDQSGDTGYQNSDYMYATASPSSHAATVPLTFGHKLHKINFKLVPGNGFSYTDLSGAEVYILAKKTTTITPSTGVASTASGTAATSVTDATNTPIKALTVQSSASAEAHVSGTCIIPPQTVSASTKFIGVKLASGVLYYTTAAATTFTTNQQTTYTITVNNTSLDVTATISAWSTNTAVDGTATF